MTGNSGLDANEIDSNAEEEEPLELRDEEVQVEYDDPDDVSSEEGYLSFFRLIRISKRSVHPHIAASLSVRKNVSIASTYRRISSNEGRHSGIGEKI